MPSVDLGFKIDQVGPVKWWHRICHCTWSGVLVVLGGLLPCSHGGSSLWFPRPSRWPWSWPRWSWICRRRWRDQWCARNIRASSKWCCLIESASRWQHWRRERLGWCWLFPLSTRPKCFLTVQIFSCVLQQFWNGSGSELSGSWPYRVPLNKIFSNLFPWLSFLCKRKCLQGGGRHVSQSWK